MESEQLHSAFAVWFLEALEPGLFTATSLYQYKVQLHIKTQNESGLNKLVCWFHGVIMEQDPVILSRWLPFSRPSHGLGGLLELQPSHLHSKVRRRGKGSERVYLHCFKMSLKFHIAFLLQFYWSELTFKATCSCKDYWEVGSFHWMAICLTKSWRFLIRKKMIMEDHSILSHREKTPT